MKAEEYGAKDIQVLEGLAAVRKRPSMYIGDTSTGGLHHLVYEVIDNSIDEVLAGFCDEIRLFIHPDGNITVEDNGRGIPIGIHEEYGISAMEVVMTKLHAGGKFDHKSYKVSGGLHGVGISVVNALSERLEVVVKREGKEIFQRYERGEPEPPITIGPSTEHGTTVTFKPDPDVFEVLDFNFDLLSNKLRELAFLNKSTKISIYDKRSGERSDFKYDGGTVAFVEYLNRNKNVFHSPIHFEKEVEDVYVEVAMQYNTSYTENVLSFANNVNTIEGGMHLSGFKSGLTRTINDYARKSGSKARLVGEDTREGLCAVLSVRLKEPKFEGQTKTKLGNTEAKGVVESVVGEYLAEYLEEHPKDASKILGKITSASHAREAAKNAKELTRRKNEVGISLPGKLSSCSSKDPSECEIYIVEGESAGGSAKQGRDRKFQAILPLKGKILNVEKSRLDKMLKNTEIRSMIAVIGAGVGEDFEIDKIRYHKIIIMTDADVDGAHIRTLLLTFFYRYMRPLIEGGCLYIAQPPLYRVKKGKEGRYAYDDDDLHSILEKFNGADIQRYKGLGEMNPDQLWKTTMDPEARKMKKVRLEDAIEADEIFTILMGEKVEPRRRFIQQHSKEVLNLDI